jgi:hypothetical protein
MCQRTVWDGTYLLPASSVLLPAPRLCAPGSEMSAKNPGCVLCTPISQSICSQLPWFVLPTPGGCSYLPGVSSQLPGCELPAPRVCSPSSRGVSSQLPGWVFLAPRLCSPSSRGVCSQLLCPRGLIPPAPGSVEWFSVSPLISSPSIFLLLIYTCMYTWYITVC